MRALSLRSPWATLVADGVKSIETRTWQTHYRGPLLIVQSLGSTPLRVTHLIPPSALARVGDDPRGHALAVAVLADCRPMVEGDEAAACCRVYPRAWAWVLREVRRIQPFPVLGRLGMYEVALPGRLLP